MEFCNGSHVALSRHACAELRVEVFQSLELLVLE